MAIFSLIPWKFQKIDFGKLNTKTVLISLSLILTEFEKYFLRNFQDILKLVESSLYAKANVIVLAFFKRRSRAEYKYIWKAESDKS